MPLRSFSNLSKYLLVPAFILGTVAGAAYAASPSSTSVQTYTDQALPVQAPPAQDYYNGPLAAGTLTLEDVLQAHSNAPTNPPLPAIGASPSATATAPLLTPPVQESSTSLMMSQGMKDVLQKVGTNNVAPVKVNAPALEAQGQPASLVPTSTTPASVSGVQYEPGQEPKNLATGQAVTASTPTPATAPSAAPATSVPTDVASVPVGTSSVAPVDVSAPSSTSADQNCGHDVEKWEKSCTEAGYPANYLGKIVGETRTGCTDGALHDVWVTNTCAPPDTTAAQMAKTDGACGVASNNEYDDAPTTNLCAQGIASSVSGDGPWTWACSGVNGGDAAACSAPKNVPATNGSCGNANGVATTSVPTTDLCNSGAATEIKGNGPWKWSCKGNGKGGVESCIAPLVPGTVVSAPVPAPSVAAPEAPTTAPVSTPAVAAVATAPAPTSAPASTTTASSEKGELCGEAAETLAYQAPDKDLCRAGTPSEVNGDGPWTWSCTNNEGVTSSCRTLSLSGDATSAAQAPAAQPEEAVAAAPAATPASTAAPEAASEKTATETAATPSTTPSLQPPSATPAPAPKPETSELACGAAALQPALQEPTSDLCHNGKASSVHGSGPWNWVCSNKAHHKVSCSTPQVVDGACGAANGTSLKSAPFAGLCAFGTPSGIEGDGPWTWTCNGTGGGINVSCAASLQGKPTAVDGACGAADGTTVSVAPSAGLCVTGTASPVSGDGPWTWSCGGMNGGAVGSCSAMKMAAPTPPGPSVNGLCGQANGMTVASQPTGGLCGSGEASPVVGNGPWNWSCIGENGGMTVSCTAPLEPPAAIDGACGAANGVETLVKPQSALCSAGITGTVNGKGPWTWSCSGANGGYPASCEAPLAGKGSSSSVMVPAVSGDELSAPSAAPAGLVTPRLPSQSDIPSLDKKTIPSLTSSKAFASAPTPTAVPEEMDVVPDEAPTIAPPLPPGSEPVQPPAVGKNLPSAPVLQEQPTDTSSHIPGNHLTLDPTISTVLFDRGSGNIAENVVTTLDKLAAVLQNNPDVRISLIAYADNTGSTPRDARRLSLTRALAVRDYLSAKGISQSRVDIHAEGANTTSGYIDRVDVKVND